MLLLRAERACVMTALLAVADLVGEVSRMRRRVGTVGGERVLAPLSVSADLTEKLISQLVVRSKAWLDQHVRARFMCHISHTHTHTHPATYTIHICMCVVLLGNH